MKTFTFKSEKNPDSAIEINQDIHGMYYIVAAVDQLPPDLNTFASIEDIENVLDDSLELIIRTQ